MIISKLRLYSFNIAPINQAPFIRPESAKTENFHSKYYGVVKIDPNKDEYSVEFPRLVVEDYTKKPFQLPSCCTAGEKEIILMSGIYNEYLAGQFYSFVIRVLYGEEGVKEATKDSCNTIVVE